MSYFDYLESDVVAIIISKLDNFSDIYTMNKALMDWNYLGWTYPDREYPVWIQVVELKYPYLYDKLETMGFDILEYSYHLLEHWTRFGISYIDDYIKTGVTPEYFDVSDTIHSMVTGETLFLVYIPLLSDIDSNKIIHVEKLDVLFELIVDVFFTYMPMETADTLIRISEYLQPEYASMLLIKYNNILHS